MLRPFLEISAVLAIVSCWCFLVKADISVTTTDWTEYTQPPCNGQADMLSDRYAPLYGKKMEANSNDDSSTFWVLVWGKTFNRTQQAYWSINYVQVICYVALPRQLDGQRATVSPVITIVNTPEDCFNGPIVGSEQIFLVRSGSPPDHFIMTAKLLDAWSDTDNGISTWLTVTNLCPIWRLDSIGSNCPNMYIEPRLAYNVPPGCFSDISVPQLEQQGAASFLYHTSLNCKQIGPDSFSARVTSQTVKWTVWGRLTDVDYSTPRQFSFFNYCLMFTPKEIIHSAPRQPFDGFIPPEYDGCFEFDREAAENNVTFVVFLDGNYYVKAAAIASDHLRYRLLAGSCVIPNPTRMVLAPSEAGFCEAAANFTTDGCYPDVSVRAVMKHDVAMSPTDCPDSPCIDFNKVYAAADNVLWVTITSIAQSLEDDNEFVLVMSVNCYMKSGPYDIENAVVTTKTHLMEPLVQNRDYIIAVKVCRVVAGVPQYEVISPPIAATKANWHSLCTSCATTSLPRYYPGGMPLSYFYDLCSADTCYFTSRTPPNPPPNCQNKNLTTFVCPGSSDSLAARFATSTVTLLGQVTIAAHRPSNQKDEIDVLFPNYSTDRNGENKLSELGRYDRELHITVVPLCQLSGNANDLGPSSSIQVILDSTDCFNRDDNGNPAIPLIQQGDRFIFFLDAQTARTTALPIPVDDYSFVTKLIGASCAIAPPEYPAVGVGRAENIDVEYLNDICPNAKKENCVKDYSIANISTKTIKSQFLRLSSLQFLKSDPKAGADNQKSTTPSQQPWIILLAICMMAMMACTIIYSVQRFKRGRTQVTEDYITEEPRLILAEEDYNTPTENTPLIIDVTKREYTS